MTPLSDLLSDSGAQIELIVKGIYLDENDALHTEWVSQTGWDDPIGGIVGTHIPPLLSTGLRISEQLEPLDLKSSFNSFGDIELSNNHIDYPGRYDAWWHYSVDRLPWIVYAVGSLSNGTRVELSDVENYPLASLSGIHTPEVGSSSCTIRCRDRKDLGSALQPVTYSPPALSFPGTVAGAIDLGNNLNITGNQSISVWVYLPDPISTTQYIAFKDSGAAGYYLAVGLVGGGTIAGGVEILVRGQSPTTTTTAANVLRAYQWHRIDVSVGTATRRIDIDGVTAITTSAITGTPTTTTTSLTIGRSFLGRMSRLLYWTNARTQAVMSAEGRTPITGLETNLREAFLFGEGTGNTTTSFKSGSVLGGILGTGTTWDTASWHYSSILGQHEPFVLGIVPRVPVTWIDPPKQVGQVSKGPIALFAELQSNHAVVSTANYTPDLTNGTVTVSVGALSGTYSATVTANNLWNSALLFNGTSSGAVATVTMPAASKYIALHFRADNSLSTLRQLAAWNASNSAFGLRFTTGAVNLLQGIAFNDAGVSFVVNYQIVQGRRYSVLLSLNTATPATGLQMFINGESVGTAAISGAWTGTQPTLSIGWASIISSWYFAGVIDEIVVGNTAGNFSIAQAHHLLPSVSSLTGAMWGCHFDEATGSTAAPFVGSGNVTLTNTTWTSGRSSALDLARSVLYREGYTSVNFDPTSWLESLSANPADCGLLVASGTSGIEILNTVLGGLGFVLFESSEGLIKIKRFEGLTGTPDVTLNPDMDLQAKEMLPLAADPPIYQWTILFAINDTKLDGANVAGSLATSDPDRYQYASMPSKSISKSDGSILERFPGAEHRTRITALINIVDAENEAARLLSLHRHGGDRKSIEVFLSAGGVEILTELGPLTEQLELNSGNLIITGLTIEDGTGAISTWRPAN